MWIGHLNAGVRHWDGRAWRSILQNSGPTNLVAYAVTTDPSDQVWTGFISFQDEDNLVNRFDGRKWTRYSSADGMLKGDVLGIRPQAVSYTHLDVYKRQVLDALAEAGVDRGAIDAVIVTHLHFDHAGGLTHLDEEGQPVPSFPNAEVIVQRQEWEDALANRSTMTRTCLLYTSRCV